MRVWQNALAMLATVLAAFALLPLPARVRLVCITGAGAVIGLLLVLRVGAHGRRTMKERTGDTYAQIERIRALRSKRSGRRTPPGS